MKKRISNEIFSVIIFLLILLGLWLWLYRGAATPVKAPTQDSLVLPQPTLVPTSAVPGSVKPSPINGASSGAGTKSGNGVTQSQGTFSSGENQPDGSSIAVVAMNFDGTNINPSTVDIKVDDYVFLKNQSATVLEVKLVDPTGAIVQGGIVIQPAKEFKYQFKNAGEWKYLSVANSKILGIVNVSK